MSEQSDKNDYSSLLPHIDGAFQRYYNLGHAMVAVEMMKRDRKTGDVSMETVNIVLLDPTSYKLLHAILPLLHNAEMQEHLLTVLDETIARGLEDGTIAEVDKDGIEPD